MPGLVKIERISGEPLVVGSKTSFTSEHKGKDFVIEETVLESKLPSSVKFEYNSKMGYNTVEIVFEETDANTTRQVGHNYFEMKGFMKLAAPLMKGMFKKQSMLYMDGFKEYAEKSLG